MNYCTLQFSQKLWPGNGKPTFSLPFRFSFPQNQVNSARLFVYCRLLDFVTFSALHFTDNTLTDFKENRMLKLGTFLPIILSEFQSLITPGRNVTIDEMLKFKGRLSFKQYIPSKIL